MYICDMIKTLTINFVTSLCHDLLPQFFLLFCVYVKKEHPRVLLLKIQILSRFSPLQI